jgi:hypothetical protein
MNTRLLRIIAGLALAVSTMPLWAHHALVAVFDPSKQKDFKGTVTRVEWLNPHARFDMDIAEPGGKTASWEFELGSPNSLMQHGWNRYTLKKGDMVAVTGDLARDGSKFAHVRSITLPGGARVCDYDRFNDAAWSCVGK